MSAFIEVWRVVVTILKVLAIIMLLGMGIVFLGMWWQLRNDL